MMSRGHGSRMFKAVRGAINFPPRRSAVRGSASFPSNQAAASSSSSGLLAGSLGCRLRLRFRTAIASHDPIAERLVRRFHGVLVNRERLPARVLGDEFEAELVVLELLRAPVA